MNFRREVVMLVMILLFAAALRLWNYEYDPLHHGKPRSGDVSNKIGMSIRVAEGNFRPKDFNHPYYLCYSTGFFFRFLPSSVELDTRTAFRISALLMIGYAVLTVGLTYALGKAVFGESKVALLSALLLAVVPLNVIGSRYFKEDIPLMFFMNLAMLLLVLTLRSSRRWMFLPAGAAVGLALTVKYVAAILIPFYILCQGVRVWHAPSGTRGRVAADPFFLLGMIAVPVVFLLVNPYVIIDWERFLSTFESQQEYAFRGHHDGTVIRGRDYWWTFYLVRAIMPGLSLPVTLASLSGIVLALRKRNVEAAFVAAWITAFYLMVESSPAKPFPFFARYIHGLAPGLCMLAAYALCNFSAAAVGRRASAATAGFIVAVCIGFPLARSSLINISLKEDTRETASRWMNGNLDKGTTVCVDSKHYAARPSEDRFRVLYRSPLTLGALRRWKVDFIVIGSFSHVRFGFGKGNDERARRAFRYYRNLSTYGKLVGKFEPRFKWQTYGFHNPVVRIYDLRGLDGEGPSPAERTPLTALPPALYSG